MSFIAKHEPFNLHENFKLFQVVTGGQLDVDASIETPSKKPIYKELRKGYDSFKFNTTVGAHFRPYERK